MNYLKMLRSSGPPYHVKNQRVLRPRRWQGPALVLNNLSHQILVRGVILAAALTLVTLSGLETGAQTKGKISGSCPNWSSQFDQIQNPEMVQQLRMQQNTGWDNLIAAGIAQGTDLNGQITATTEVLQKLQDLVEQSDETISGLGGGDYQAMDTVACGQAADQSALGAALCARLNLQNSIHLMAGMLDLMTCRTGLPNGSKNGGSGHPNSTPSGAAKDHSSENIDSLLSVLGDEPSSGHGSDRSLAVDSRASVESLLSVLGDGPSPQRRSSGSSDLSSGSGVDSLLSVLDARDASWTDPLSNVSDARSDSVVSRQDPATPDGNVWKDLSSDLLKRGISNTGEFGGAAVQSFDNLQGWNKFYSSNASDQTEGATTIANGANDAFNTNPVSRIITDQSISVVGAVAQQENKIIDTMDRAMLGGGKRFTGRSDF